MREGLIVPFCPYCTLTTVQLTKFREEVPPLMQKYHYLDISEVNVIRVYVREIEKILYDASVATTPEGREYYETLAEFTAKELHNSLAYLF